MTAVVDSGLAPPQEAPTGAAEGLGTQEPLASPTGDVASTEGTGAAQDLYTVTIDGEERQVSLDEALRGYMMQGDYTRKTQALAAQREQLEQHPALRLWGALQEDPMTVLQALQQTYGEQPESDDLEDLDPEEKRWSEVQQFMADQRQKEVDAQIDQALAGLHGKHGEFSDEALIKYAVDNSIFDLDKAYKAWAFDVLQDLSSQRTQRLSQADAEAAARKAAQPPVAGGHGVQAGAVAAGAAGEVQTFRDAWERAKQQHGVTFE